jgi:peptidoglycan hydrolase-like protein with peptidoglycan-binding domain
MPSATVFWFGPVNLTQVPGATVPGAYARALPCTADASPTCGQIAESLLDGGGRRLPRLARRLGRDEGTLGDLFLGAFSAGGSMIKRLLLHEADRAAVRAVLLADATYTDWASPGNPLAPEGFVLFCLEALRGGKLFVATASSSSPGNNRTLPGGAQTIHAIRREVEARSGRMFEPYELPEGIHQRPVAAFRLGDIILADYQTSIPHGAHATSLAAPIWQKILLPWLRASPEAQPAPAPVDDVSSLVAALLDLQQRGEILSCERSPDRGAVRFIQRALIGVDIELVADGVFGPPMEAAVKAFQKRAGLSVNGIVDPTTLASLAQALDKNLRSPQ